MVMKNINTCFLNNFNATPMKRILVMVMALMMAGTAVSQVDQDSYEQMKNAMRQRYNQQKNQMHKQYDESRRKAEAEYAAFRKKANEEYVEAVRRAWQQMGVEPALPKPKEPAPPRPPKPQVDKLPTTVPLPQDDVVPVAPKLPPAPVPPIPEPSEELPLLQFAVYGTPCSVHADATDLHFRLASADEKSVAAAWQQLSGEKYDGLLHDCLARRDELSLSDWGYLRLLGSMSEKMLGSGSNEAVLLQMYLFVQSGYKARLARQNGRLVMLVPFSHKIYSYSYVTLDGEAYYVLSTVKQGGVEVCQVGFPKEQVADIAVGKLPNLEGNPQPHRTFAAQRFGTMKAEVAVNKSLIDFMNDYPLSDAWDCYARAGLSEGVKAGLYPVLKAQIEGKSQKKAATMLLDFVQSAFDYATDQDQFGYERPLFGDESFYYPKNDCEDRSILYSILVRDLLGLDVVLVHWPGHLATAVAFPDEVEGDYYTVDGRRFTICDPTYIGADVGMTMPQFQDVSAKLLKL